MVETNRYHGIEKYYITLFIIILVIIMLGVCVCKKIATAIFLPLSTPLFLNKKGGSFKDKPYGIKNILLVDIANMYVGWYIEKYGDVFPYNKQTCLMKGYVNCMKDHYKHFSEKNDTSTDAVNYIIKNYKYSRGPRRAMVAPSISEETWGMIYDFIKNSPGAHVTVAEDYRLIPYSKWKAPESHYLRGRDDYLCFRMAQYYKKKYINSVIMSNDNYKDYEQFGYVPDFLATYIHAKWGDADSKDPEIVQTEELVKPRPNTLGQMRDYKMVKITLEFQFDDPKFLKSSDYKIPKPGKVWKH